MFDYDERIAVEKDRLSLPGKPLTSFVRPGHPLPDSTLDFALGRCCDLL